MIAIILIAIIVGVIAFKTYTDRKSSAEPTSDTISDKPTISTPSFPTLPLPITGGDTLLLKEKLKERVYKTYTPTAFGEITEAIVKWSKEFGLIPEWVAAVAIVESSYGQQLRNPFSTAVGVMQITKPTLDTINNIIRSRYQQFIEYASHDHERITYDHDSNVMHACVYMRHIMGLISLKYNRSNIFDDYFIMQYLYHSGPGYLNRFTDDYATIVQKIKAELTPSTATSPYNWDSVSYVRKVYSYYITLR